MRESQQTRWLLPGKEALAELGFRLRSLILRSHADSLDYRPANEAGAFSSQLLSNAVVVENEGFDASELLSGAPRHLKCREPRSHRSGGRRDQRDASLRAPCVSGTCRHPQALYAAKAATEPRELYVHQVKSR